MRVLPDGDDDAGNLSNKEYEPAGIVMNSLFYKAIVPVLCPVSSLLDFLGKGWLHILLGDVGDKIADVICRYVFPGLVLGLAIYDLIKKLKDR